MSRLQYCRKHIDDVAEACDLSKSTVLEVKQASTFCDANSEFSELPTNAILTLIRVKDDKIRERAISLAQKALNLTTPTGGQKNKQLKAKDIKKIIDIACTEIRMERPKDSVDEPKETKKKPKLAELITAKQQEITAANNLLTKLRGELAALLAQEKQEASDELDEYDRTHSQENEPEPAPEPVDADGAVIYKEPKPKHEGSKPPVAGLQGAPLHGGRRVDIDEPITEILVAEYSYMEEP